MPIRFQVDPDFYDHPKTIGMSDAATALWVRAGSYSAAKTSDGFIAEHALALLSQTPMDAARELCRRGLWKRVKGGFQFHEWDGRNLTRARVESEREYEREKKRRQRREAQQQVNGSSVPPGLPGESRGSPGPVPPLSVSVSVSESVSGSGQAAARASPEPPGRCPTHLDDPDPPPCGPCAEARRARTRWEIAEAERRRTQPKCRKHRGQPADTCGLCRSERLADAGTA